MKTSEKKRGPWFIAFQIAAVISIALCGCGGGGGDESPAPTPSPITYTGLTTEALITAANADDMLSMAYGGGEFGLIVAAQTEQPQSRYFRYPVLILFLKRSAEEGIPNTASAPATVTAAMQTRSRTYVGDCGGTMVITLTYDDVTGDYTGTMAFNSYCSDGLTGTGTASISGILDLGTLELLTLSMQSDMIAFSGGAGSFQIRFDLSYDWRALPWTATLSSWLREPSGKTYWIDSYVMTVQPEAVDPPTYLDYTMAGRAYHPDYGYVTVQMTNPIIPFRLYSVDEWPSQGQLEAIGRTGTAGGNSNGRLTALNNLQYRIEVDEDGNGAYERTEVLDW